MSTALQLVLTTLLWAGMFHVGKYTLGLMAPLSVALWRFLIAAAVLAPWVAMRGGWPWPALRANALTLIAMGVIGVMGFNLCMFYGLQHSNAVNGALIGAINPAFTVMLSAALGVERISWPRVLGLALGLVGIGVVVTGGSLAALRALTFASGDLAFVAGAVCWAVYSVLPRRFLRGLEPLQVSAASIVSGALALCLCALLLDHSALQLPPPRTLLALLYMGVGASAFAYIWWTGGVMRVGPARAVLYMNLVPIFTALMGVALGQRLSAAQVSGAVLVIGGVVIATRMPRAKS